MTSGHKNRILLSPPHLGGHEQEFVNQAFASNYIAPVGPMVNAFENEFAESVGIPHTVAVSSGTAAMHLALRLLGVGSGDEVFVSTLTFIGSASPIIFQGARPVFIDSDYKTWGMDPDLLAEELKRCAMQNRLPKAVVPTDLYGQCANYERINSICADYKIPVIADAAESLGASFNGHNAGAKAYAKVYSFNGNKIITTSGGGMLASSDSGFIEKARHLSQQAREPFAHYEHEEIGYNYRMSNIVAAIGRGQLRVLEERVKQKHAIFNYYHEALNDIPGIEFMPEASYGRSNRWLTVILIDTEKFGATPEQVRLALEDENIESRPVWKPMHLQPAFKIIDECNSGKKRIVVKDGKHEARAIGGKVAEDLFFRGLCLPSGTQLSKSDQDRVIEMILKCCRQQALSSNHRGKHSVHQFTSAFDNGVHL
jgi:dTDP-4-amino-4,6-dideoxygalactose transaminase